MCRGRWDFIVTKSIKKKEEAIKIYLSDKNIYMHGKENKSVGVISISTPGIHKKKKKREREKIKKGKIRCHEYLGNDSS